MGPLRITAQVEGTDAALGVAAALDEVAGAVAASISMAIAPAGLGGSPGPGQCEPCTRNRPIRNGGNAWRFSASQSRSGNLSSTM